MTTTRDALGGSPRASSLALGRRGAFAGVAYALAVTMLGTTLPTPLYPLYRSEFGLSDLLITVIFATYAVGVLAALLLFGELSDQIGRRRMLLPAVALSALSAVVFQFADGVAPLLVGRALSGLAAGIFTGTATAALADLAPPGSRERATLVATVANIGGLGCGPLLAGLLAQFSSLPLRLPFWMDLALLVPAAAFVWAMPEPVPVAARVRLRLRTLRVPAEVRAVFVRAALAGFAGFGVLGLFTAVVPTFLGQIVGVDSPAIVGLVVFAMFAASTIGQAALEPALGTRALAVGCVGLIVGMGLLVLGLALSSLGLVIAGGVVAGLGQGLTFRHGLAAISAVSPAEHRGAVTSSFFVIAYLAISAPVVGVGVIAGVAGLTVAGSLLAALVAALAATVLVLSRRDVPGEVPLTQRG